MTHWTYLEERWPNSPSFQSIAKRWSADKSRLLLSLVWQGCDLLIRNNLTMVPLHRRHEAKEESLNFLLAGSINSCMCGDEPFWFCHQPPETTKRKRGGGRSPTPDHGFIAYGNARAVWPLEGKIVEGEKDVNAYVAEVQGNFLTGRYATLSREGAMVGYLLGGDPNVTFKEIGIRINAKLKLHPHFRTRPHRVSNHRRIGKLPRKSPKRFTCNHLILCIPTV